MWFPEQMGSAVKDLRVRGCSGRDSGRMGLRSSGVCLLAANDTLVIAWCRGHAPSDIPGLMRAEVAVDRGCVSRRTSTSSSTRTPVVFPISTFQKPPCIGWVRPLITPGGPGQDARPDNDAGLWRPPSVRPATRQKQDEAPAFPAHALVRSVRGVAFAADEPHKRRRDGPTLLFQLAKQAPAASRTRRTEVGA
jgi:hypothetical protein